MSDKITKQQVLDIKTDVKLLLECMSYQKDNPSALKQALVTISSILQSFNEAKDIFRDMGGIQSVWDTVSSTRHGEVTEAGLYCLGSAVERNGSFLKFSCKHQTAWIQIMFDVLLTDLDPNGLQKLSADDTMYSQKLLSTASTFTFIHSILSDVKGTSVRKKQTAAFLILCLVSNNGFGQNLARQSSCLHDVISLIRTCLPKDRRGDSPSEWLEGLEGISLELWSTLVSTLCVCVNNPQNEENQRICASLLPYLFSLLQEERSHKVTRPVLSLVGLAVANNVQNQDRVRKCGGLDTFVKLLKKLLTNLDTDPGCKTTAIHLLNTMDSCITDNEENAKKIGVLGAIPLMLKMLTDRSLDDEDKTQIVLTLAHAADIYVKNQEIIQDSGGITSLIQQLTQTENEELSKTVKYLLHMCVSSDAREALETDENNNMSEVESLVAKMERMKKHSDIQMLQKINDLDKKLKTMEKEASDRQDRVDQVTSADSREAQARTDSICDRRKESPHRIPVIRGESSQCQEAPMTPREKKLIAQLSQEKKEKQRLERLNQMLQENIHVCLAQVAARDDPKTSDFNTPTAVPATPKGDASELRSYKAVEQTPESRHQCQPVCHPTEISEKNNHTFNDVARDRDNDRAAVCKSGNTNYCRVCKAYDNINADSQKDLNNNGGKVKSDFEICNEMNTIGNETNTICNDNEHHLMAVQQALPSNGVHYHQTDHQIQSCRSHTNAERDQACGSFKQQTIPVPTLHVCNVKEPYHCQQSYVKPSQNRTETENRDNIQGCMHNADSKLAKVFNGERNKEIDLNNNDITLTGQTVYSRNGACCTRTVGIDSETGGAKTNVQNIRNLNTVENVCTDNNISRKKQLKYLGVNLDRVSPRCFTEPFVMLERISAGEIYSERSLAHKSGSEQNVTTKTGGSVKNDKEDSRGIEQDKNKARRVLLGYTNAVSKSTCTTPSLSKLTEDSQESTKSHNINLNAVETANAVWGVDDSDCSRAKQTTGSVSSEVLQKTRNCLQPKSFDSSDCCKVKEPTSSTSDVLQKQRINLYQNEKETSASTKENETDKITIGQVKSQTGPPASNLPSQVKTRLGTPASSTPSQAKTPLEKSASNTPSQTKAWFGTSASTTPSQAKARLGASASNTTSNTKTPQGCHNDTFVKPLATAPRRKVRMTPNLGSDKLTRATISKISEDLATANDEQSDIESEFDFQLLQTSRQSKHHFSGSSKNKTASETSVKGNRETSTMDCMRSMSSQNKCSDWTVTPMTPEKRQCVPPRPAFSDCGSRRPVLGTPMSVKSVGKLRKRTLDDSGIYSPGNMMPISPGGSSLSGSSQALTDISSCFDNIEDNREPKQKRETRNRMTIYEKQHKCPGCWAPLEIGGQILNSRTYNIVLETDPNTCRFHRKLRQLERLQIQQVRQNKSKRTTSVGLLKTLRADQKRKERNKSKDSVYDFGSSASEMLSPPRGSTDEYGGYPARRKRRQRLDYTEDEEQNLLEGVRKMGKYWQQIILTYKFHPSRTAVDLKDKYKSMMKSAETKSTCSSVRSGRSRTSKPFSMCEERRLRRGIKQFGYSWKTILAQYTFSRERTAEDLRNRWRCMHRRDMKGS